MFPSLERAIVKSAPQLICIIYSSFESTYFFYAGSSYILTCKSNSFLEKYILWRVYIIGGVGGLVIELFRVLGFFIPKGRRERTNLGYW